MNDHPHSFSSSSAPPTRIDLNTPRLQRKRRWRALQDRLTRWVVLVGGLAVLAAITLIFFFLAYVVLPLFQGASLASGQVLEPTWLQQAGEPRWLSIEEQNQVGLRISDQGQAIFFRLDSGALLARVDLPLPAGAHVVSIAHDQPASSLLVAGLSNGRVLVLRHLYKVSYPAGVKIITPDVGIPLWQRAYRAG